MENKDKVIARIKKLLAKKDSNFKDEAESAMLKAQQLMIEYDIEISLINLDQKDEKENVIQEAIVRSQPPVWHGRIGAIIAKNFRCTSYWDIQWINGTKKRLLFFLGNENDVSIAKEVYIYAIALIKYNIKRLKKRYPCIKRGYINNYINGFINGLRDKFEEQVQNKNYGLILVKSPEVLKAEEKLQLVKGPEDKRKSSNSKSAYQKGYIAGKTFDFNIKN